MIFDDLLFLSNKSYPGKNHDDLYLSELSYVLKKNNMPDLEISIRQCKKDDLDAIIALQSVVYNSIAVKQTFVFSTTEELAESLSADVCLGAYRHTQLIAFTLIIKPYSSRNLGFYLDYSDEECLKCVTYDTTFVHPEYTGYGLQRLFLKLKDSIAKAIGASAALATVSPDNTMSLNNLIENGFVIIDEKQMYGDFYRYIMRKPLA